MPNSSLGRRMATHRPSNRSSNATFVRRTRWRSPCWAKTRTPMMPCRMAFSRRCSISIPARRPRSSGRGCSPSFAIALSISSEEDACGRWRCSRKGRRRRTKPSPLDMAERSELNAQALGSNRNVDGHAAGGAHDARRRGVEARGHRGAARARREHGARASRCMRAAGCARCCSPSRPNAWQGEAVR